ncbi:MAG: phage Gp37/Gp68 family protein [Ferruginibacter sp.]
MAQSHIEWTEMTWNPTTGCNKISTGCKFCYAEIMTKRLEAMGMPKYKDGFKLRIHPETLNIPYTWSGNKLVFVNSMSDLFHDEVPLSFIKDVFKVMNECSQHTFQVLTKRAERLFKIHKELTWSKNIWMGVSVENEKVVHRIDFLQRTKAKTKFLSLEPLLGPLGELDLRNIDWVIVGGESGPKARPVKKEWITDIQITCKKQKVAFFFKQWGKPQFNVNPDDPTIQKAHINHAKGGCQIDGKIYRQMPKAV